MQTTMPFVAPEPEPGKPARREKTRRTGEAAPPAQFDLLLPAESPPAAAPTPLVPPQPASPQPASLKRTSPPAVQPPAAAPPAAARQPLPPAFVAPPAAPLPLPASFPANTRFVVQAFQPGKRGGLVAEPPVVAPTAASACMRAERMAPRKAGVVACALRADSDLGDYAEPVILARFGELPEEMA